ncbi:MAG: hypothetical protein ACKOI2_11750 [Actinomycetota bacterium]
MTRTADMEIDKGSVVVLALVTVLIGGVALSALTSYAVAMIRTQTTQQQRIELEGVGSSTLTAASSILELRGGDPSTMCPTAIRVSTGLDVAIRCSTVGQELPIPKAGLVTTLNGSTVGTQTLPTWVTGIEQVVNGSIVLQSGSLSNPQVLYLPDERLRAADEPPRTWSPLTASWSDFASRHSIDIEPGDSNSMHGVLTYPPLPPIPLYQRPGSQAAIGSCSIYFPGRYLGTTSLLLSGGTHYFVSGVYYFERTLAISNGARVVMGQGPHQGCTTDADAAREGRSPREHEISGRGVSLLFGSAARLIVQESSLLINAPNDEEATSVRTVSFGTSTATIAVPADLVRTDDGSLQLASAHTVVPPESSSPVSYKSSTLVPETAFAVDVRLNGSNVATNRVIIEGQVFVPHGGLRVTSTTSTYRVAMTGGVVAARLNTSLPLAPTGGIEDFTIGVDLPDRSSSLVSIEVVVGDGRRTLTSSAVFRTDSIQWALVERSRRHRRSP